MSPARLIATRAIRCLRDLGRAEKRGRKSRVTIARKIRDYRACLAQDGAR